MCTTWVWSWQEASYFGETIGGIGTALALLWAVTVFRQQVLDARKAQSKRVLFRFEGTRQPRLVVENLSDLPVDQVMLFLPFKPPGQQHVPLEPTAYAHELRGWMGIDSNVLGPKAREVASRLKPGEAPDGCYVTFRDTASRSWRRDVDGTLRKFKPPRAIRAA